MVPLLLASPAPSNFQTYVRNLPYATASSDDLKSMFQNGLSRLTSVPLTLSDRTDAVSGCAHFGEALLNTSRSNVPFVRDNIITNPLVSTFSGGPSSPSSLPLLLLDLRCASYKGEVEHSLNLLNSLDEPERTEEMYARALSALTRSLKYDSYLLGEERKKRQGVRSAPRSKATVPPSKSSYATRFARQQPTPILPCVYAALQPC